MKIAKATSDDIRSVALAMRAIDYEEFSAVSYALSRDELADAIVDRLSGRDDVLVGSLDEPIFIGATIEGRPNVITLLFYATDRLPEIGMALNSWIVTELFPRFESAGVHRFETIVAARNTRAQQWLQTIGLRRECDMRKYGRHGEDFQQFARVLP